MSVAARTYPARARRLPPRELRRGSGSGPKTLDERVTAAWMTLVESGSGECLVCGGEVRATSGCEGCGSRLG